MSDKVKLIPIIIPVDENVNNINWANSVALKKFCNVKNCPGVNVL